LKNDIFTVGIQLFIYSILSNHRNVLNFNLFSLNIFQIKKQKNKKKQNKMRSFAIYVYLGHGLNRLGINAEKA